MINRRLIRESRWVDECQQKVSTTIRAMVQPYTLEDLYPVVEIEQPDGSVIETQDVMPHQRKFHKGVSLCNKKSFFRLFNGGVGSGKSTAAAVEAIRLCKTYPNYLLTCVTAYDYYIDEFIWPTMYNVMGSEPQDSPIIKRCNYRTRTWYFTNGSQLRFKAYDDPAKIKGWSTHGLWIEEASEMGNGINEKGMEIWKALLMRLRSGGGFPRHVFLTQNPKGHTWVWRLFIRKSPQRDNPVITWIRKPGTNGPQDPGVRFSEYEFVSLSGDVYYTISSGTDSNLHLPAGYLETMLDNYSDDPAIRRRMVEGDFNPINTLVYGPPYYIPEIHIVDRESVFEFWELDRTDERDFPRYWKLWVGIDTAGSSSPWAIQFYVETPEGPGFPARHLIAIGEIYVKGLTWLEIADQILEFTVGPRINKRDWESPRDERRKWKNVTYMIDPISSKQAQGPNQINIEEQFLHYGIATQQPRGYNKEAGIKAVQNVLKPDRFEPHPYLSDTLNEETDMWEKGFPGLIYLKDPEYVESYDEQRPGSVDNPHGRINYFNNAEKEVYRRNSKKARAIKESEEGLTREKDEKPVDSDDHAATAEMFVCLEYKPPFEPKNMTDREARSAMNRYAGQRKTGSKGRR